MQRYHFCEIDLAAIRHNVGVMKSHIAGGARFLAVVKADAYGHGAVPVAKAALEAGADMLAVAIPEEGIELREAGIAAPILVLGGIEESAAEAVVQNDLTQVVFDERRIRALAQAGQKLGRCAKVHLKLDTGMNRIGVRTAEEAQALTRLIDSLSGVALTGCFTHMATADEPDPTGTLRQIERFEALCKAVKAVHPGKIICHGKIVRLADDPLYLIPVECANVCVMIFHLPCKLLFGIQPICPLLLQILVELNVSFQFVLIQVTLRECVQFLNDDLLQLLHRNKGADAGVLCHVPVGALQIVLSAIF